MKTNLFIPPNPVKLKDIIPARKKEKRNKSGLLPSLYSQLTEEEKKAVSGAMIAYNNLYSDRPFFEAEQFYQQIYRNMKRLTTGA